MAVKQYQKKIWKNKKSILILFLVIIVGCNTQNNPKTKTYPTAGEKNLDYSTSSNFIIVRIGRDTKDTMTIVVPSEILYRYLKQEYSSDSLYANAITMSTKKYLMVPREVYEGLKNYQVNFNDGFIATWMFKGKEQIIDSFFEKGSNGLYYSCFDKTTFKNQVLFLLICKDINLYKDDETGCAVISS